MALAERLIDWRRELHQYPELSGQEVETTARIHHWLEDAGLRLLPYPLHTGVVAEVGKGDKVIALRADIDALPIDEADSLGLKLKLVPTSWEDWPLGITSGRYDVALVNIAVTEQRKEKFDFATYRVDSLAFSVKAGSEIKSISGPEDVAGLRVIVGSGTNQEKILLGWNEQNQRAGRKPALLA